MTKAANTLNSTPVRDRVLPRPPKVAVINETKLDMSPEEFTARLAATQVSHKQFFQLTDITRPRLKRVCDGEKKSLVERKPGVFVVPRLFVVVLLAIESGLLVVGEESC
ncbi:hypothetical protein HNR26_004777 [Rhizobium rosettiformans]|uniref:Uncharacterized protein n=2 Tax=Rhizobium rosettiformans TaxID=1368430 RepID=A0A4S8PNI8_9HYPH|nr:hypothetical protein [Rhizobium rosettiformans]MBB5278675.1 hypothetical protein [Rhizobium rosettiformans]THV29944.1 hypothetical protein FAA86_23065 [Rhizobium rosettiformans W3]